MSLAKLHIQFQNPFGSDADFKNLWFNTWHVGKHKALELQFVVDAANIFELDIDVNFRGQDHAGPRFELNLFGWIMILHLYDTRHWNYETNNWEIYDNTDS